MEILHRGPAVNAVPRRVGFLVHPFLGVAYPVFVEIMCVRGKPSWSSCDECHWARAKCEWAPAYESSGVVVEILGSASGCHESIKVQWEANKLH